MSLSIVAAIYGVMSLATFALYGWDKHRAIRGQWRVPERTLHTLELLGGWPGALAAQSLFKHKRRKTAFLIVFYLIILLHAAAWTAWWRYLK